MTRVANRRRVTPTTNREQRALGYIVEAAKVLGIVKPWRITLAEGEPADGAVACVSVIDGQPTATFQLAAETYTATAEERRETIAHELLHVCTWPQLTALELAERHLSPATYQVVRDGYVEAWEQATERLARVIAPLLPLPGEWQQPEPTRRR